jgi:hypothetical protein
MSRVISSFLILTSQWRLPRSRGGSWHSLSSSVRHCRRCLTARWWECELEVALPQVRTSPRREPSFALVRVQNQALAPPGAGHGSEDACRPRHVETNKRHRSSRRRGDLVMSRSADTQHMVSTSTSSFSRSKACGDMGIAGTIGRPFLSRTHGVLLRTGTRIRKGAMKSKEQLMKCLHADQYK